MIKKLKENRGEFTINGALILLLIVFLMVLFISAIGVANRGMRLHSMASELARYVELRGKVDDAVYTELQRLETATGVTADLQISASYISGTSKIQYGNTFNVTLSSSGYIGLGGIVSIPIPLHSTVSGRSEQYWLS
ncbi:conserved exported hypothetical protein [uncultured Eubacteriales bacterium]|uniref:DUF4320 family protein n=1 Tax=uncultured Eubacteriales bacterium TaxID=172733 RepID=A0A212IVR4_9FIRM|nr:conserved exported hypothetical protein [uncultured Eubacteriales bacterium]